MMGWWWGHLQSDLWRPAALSLGGSNLQWAPVSALATDIQYHPPHPHHHHHHTNDDVGFSAPNQILQLANWSPVKSGVNANASCTHFCHQLLKNTNFYLAEIYLEYKYLVCEHHFAKLTRSRYEAFSGRPTNHRGGTLGGLQPFTHFHSCHQPSLLFSSLEIDSMKSRQLADPVFFFKTNERIMDVM